MNARFCSDCRMHPLLCRCFLKRLDDDSKAGAPLRATLDPYAEAARKFRPDLTAQWSATDEAFLRSLKISPR